MAYIDYIIAMHQFINGYIDQTCCNNSSLKWTSVLSWIETQLPKETEVAKKWSGQQYAAAYGAAFSLWRASECDKGAEMAAGAVIETEDP